MKLTYRGVSYNGELSNLEAIEGEVGGKYRGNQWHYHYPKHIPNLQPKLVRKYRGVAYGEVDPNQCDRPIASYFANQKQTIVSDRANSIHLENIKRNLERRLKAAEASGDRDLVDLLKDESKQLQ
jgi:Domain of unknown function (DUF4278)